MILDHEYRQLTQLAREKFGIDMGADKRQLVTHRLQPLITEMGFKGFGEYYHYLKTDTTGQALIRFINRLTTNYSYFNREGEHFDFLQRKALPQRTAPSSSLNASQINLWSAGCSSGEEAYTIAMHLRDFFENPFPQWKLEILATDIDTRILEEAHRGIYQEDRLKNVPPLMRMRYFKSVQPGIWQVKPEIKELVHLSRYNLIRSQFSFKGKFFAIFCRNVMIYFDRPTINELVERFYQVTEDQGYLFIGQTESLDKDRCPYRYVAPSIYQKV